MFTEVFLTVHCSTVANLTYKTLVKAADLRVSVKFPSKMSNGGTRASLAGEELPLVLPFFSHPHVSWTSAPLVELCP